MSKHDKIILSFNRKVDTVIIEWQTWIQMNIKLYRGSPQSKVITAKMMVKSLHTNKCNETHFTISRMQPVRYKPTNTPRFIIEDTVKFWRTIIYLLSRERFIKHVPDIKKETVREADCLQRVKQANNRREQRKNSSEPAQFWGEEWFDQRAK